MISNRRNFLKITSAGIITFYSSEYHTASGWVNSDSSLANSSNTGHFLFADERIIAETRNVQLKINSCKKLDSPVIIPEKPWETERVYTYGSAYKNPRSNNYTMWYMSRMHAGADKKDKRLTDTPDLVLYAESSDGVHWEKPELGLYEFDGSNRNNIVAGLHSPSVLIDDTEPEKNRRYKMLGFGSRQGQRGYYTAWSADGLNWHYVSDLPVISGGDTVTLMKNPLTGEYCAYHKHPHDVRGFSRRTVWLSTSSDFMHWTEPVLVLAPDEQDDTWASGADQRTEFYNMTVFFSGGLFLGLVSVFRVTTLQKDVQPHQSRVDGPVYTELVYSYDGSIWKRFPERIPVIPNGPSAWDSGCILGVSNPIITGDEIWVYYTGINTTHGGAIPPKKCVIGRATWRRDGFVSLESGGDGIVETTPLQVLGKTLTVNADASMGNLTVEILTHNGAVIPEYHRDQCVPITTDRFSHKIQWKTRSNIPISIPLRLRFVCNNSRLFSFGFES